MSTVGFSLFDTPLGRCALAWGETGIVGLQLPEGDDQKARARLLRRFPNARETAPPDELGAVIAAITSLLRGEAADLSAVPLDLADVPPFERSVYEVARTIPPGATLTYGELAARLGDRRAAREVGKALGANPFPIVVPCHRVVAAGGKLGGFSAPGGARTKQKLLAIENAHATGEPTLFG